MILILEEEILRYLIEFEQIKEELAFQIGENGYNTIGEREAAHENDRRLQTESSHGMATVKHPPEGSETKQYRKKKNATRWNLCPLRFSRAPLHQLQ